VNENCLVYLKRVTIHRPLHKLGDGLDVVSVESSAFMTLSELNYKL